MKNFYAIGVTGVLILAAGGCRKSAETTRPPGTITFNKDIAPIVFGHCSTCHRPGQTAPFPLLTYADVKKHAREISDVTARRYMPPWLPDEGLAEYLDDRHLSAEQISLIQQWVAGDAVEGNAADLPPTPKWTEGWQLGPPDLVITMPQPYTLRAEGPDVYRTFVIPVSLLTARPVAAVEFRPGNARVVHHAAMRIDRTSGSRRLDEKDAEPGFAGMNMPETSEAPEGQFLNWQPGKLAYRSPAGLSWTLRPGTDFLVQLHLHPTGKPESVQASVGFYFTDQPPTNAAVKIVLDSAAIDIPPGETNYVTHDSYRLPVDVEVLAVFPHAHYLGKDLQTYAMLPDGSKRWLFHIPNWDFNWQGDYRFAHPLILPKGTTLHMQFTYDNSAANLHNPSQPPKRVRFGLQSTDEMGEVWIQALPRNPAEMAALAQDHTVKQLKNVETNNEFRLRLNPNDARAHNELGKALLFQKNPAAALPHLRAAAQFQPELDEPHYYLGLIFRMQQQPAQAQHEFEEAIRLNPSHAKAHGNLGLMFMASGNLDQAESHFKSALAINPEDTLAREELEEIKRLRRGPGAP